MSNRKYLEPMTLTDRGTLIVVVGATDTTCYSDRQTVEAVCEELKSEFPFEGEDDASAEAQYYADQRDCVYEWTLDEALAHNYGYAWGMISEDEYDDLLPERHDNWDAECGDANTKGKLWTAVEGDSGDVCVIRGAHYVNRMWYEITERVAPDCITAVYNPDCEDEDEDEDDTTGDDMMPVRTPKMDEFLAVYNAEPIYIWVEDGYTQGMCLHGNTRTDFCEDEILALEIILHLAKDEELTDYRNSEHPDSIVTEAFVPQ